VPTTRLILDIETIPDPDLYVSPTVAPGSQAPFPPLAVHRIVTIGLLWLDADYTFKRLGVCGEGRAEADQIRDFVAFFERTEPQLVTFNGRGFDLPVILMRAMRHGVAMGPYFRLPDYRYRYTPRGHLDLADFLAEHGAARMTRLDAAARLIGLPGKVGVDGSQIQGLFNAGQMEIIRNYCLCDVVQTAFLFLRYELLRGELPREDYRRVAAALWERVAGDPRVGPSLTPGAELDRLLLRGPAFDA